MHDDEGTTPEGTPVFLPVLENDVDGVGDGLTIVDVTEPGHGTVEFVNDKVLYSPDVGYDGTDAFKYTVVDGDGLVSTASVFVDVVPVNDPPVASE